MARKMFVFDVDGTLVNDQKHLLPGTIQALHALVQAGHAVILASGRIPDATRYYYRRLNLQDQIIGCGGAMIYDIKTRKYTASRPIATPVIHELVGYAKEWQREVSFTDGRKFYRFYFGNDPIQDIADPAFFTGGAVPNPIYDDVELLSDLVTTLSIIQISLKAEQTIIQEWFDYISEKFANVLAVNESSKVYIDMSVKGVSKASAMAFLCQKLGIDQDDTYVFGDSENDVSAMLFSGTAVAMGNARDHVKKVADVIIGDNNRESIYNYLKGAKLIT